MNVLIVDDSRVVHSYVEDCLRPVEHQSIHVFNGSEGLDIIRSGKQTFDLVLLDWEMPVMDGLTLLQQLKSIDYKVPVVMMTTKNQPEDIKKVLAAGATDYIMKPFTADILLQKIQLLRQP